MQTVVTRHNAAMQSTILDHNTSTKAAVLEHNTTVQSTIVDHNAAMQSTVFAHNADMQAAIIESNETVQSTVTAQNLEVQTKLQDLAPNLGAAMQANTAVVASAQSKSAAQMDTMLVMLGQMMESLTALPQAPRVGPLVARVEEDNCTSSNVPVNDKIPAEDTSPYRALESSVRSILAAVKDRQGIFSVNEARDIVKPFVSFLQAMSSDKFIESTETSRYILHRWWESCTESELEQFREYLTTLQGMAMSAPKFVFNDNHS